MRGDTATATTPPPEGAIRPLQYACPRCRADVNLSLDDGRCAACGFQPGRIDDIVSFVERSEVDEWQNMFEQQATGPGGGTSSAVCYRFPRLHKYMIDVFRRACTPLPATASVLDAGCGNGIFWQAVFGTANVVGVDYSLGMCKQARARGMLAHHANAMALPFAEGQFDLIYSAEILQYIDDLPALLSEFARVCRPGGFIVVSTLNRSSLLRRTALAAKAVLRRESAHDPAHLRSAGEIASAARDLPLAVDAVWWIHFPLDWLYRSRGANRVFESLASNIIVRFVKADR